MENKIKNNYFEVMRPASNEWNFKLAEWICKTHFKRKGKLIDLGCGKGELVHFFQKFGFEASGLDYPQIDLEKKLKLKDNLYDYVICKFVFEHIRNITLLMSEIKRILKPGGKVLVLTDDAPRSWNNFLSDPTHVTPFTLKRLKNLGKLNDLRVITCRRWRNIPYFWRYTSLAFDYIFPFSNQLLGIFQKRK